MTFDDIKALADTRKKSCPYMLGEECKGPQCAFWVRETFGNAQDQAATVDGCMFVMQFLVGQTTMIETRRINASVDKQTSVIATVGRTLGAAVALSSAVPTEPRVIPQVIGGTR